MKKLALVMAILSVVVAGCSVNLQRDPKLNNISGVKVINKGDAEYIKEYQKSFHVSDYSSEKIKLCVLRNITNSEVMLTDASSSFYGAYTGNYYNIQKTSVVNGGNVIESDDISKNGPLIIKGNTSYMFDSGIVSVKRVVRFTLDIVPKKQSLGFTFSNIQQAQTSSGSIPNDGFFDAGAWEGAGAMQIIQALDRISEEVHSCIKS